MAKGPAAAASAGIDGFINKTIEQYRAKLLDLSSRNPLISFRHSEKSRSHIRVIDEIPEKLFEKLDSSRQLWFDPVPDPVLVPPDEETPVFEQALRKAKKSDDAYKKNVEELGPAPSERKRQKIERELRNRLRVELGFAPYKTSTDAKSRANELGIATEYDLPKSNGSNRRRHIDQKIQTLFFREDLSRKLSGLRESARSLMQDAGLSALFCAFGFLEYYESESSDEKRIAPLVFYPIELDRELESGEYKYFITGRNEEVEINVALRELLKRDYGIELPTWTEDETETDPLGSFLLQVENVISTRRDWKVRRFVTVGLFTFSTLVMYKDLDPERWPSVAPLNTQPVLRTLIAGAEVHGTGTAEDYRVDDIRDPDALLITDTDSSQHSAVIDVLKGKNLVIQGPPGTGKSQTITNIISAALFTGKSILFVAEKMAALEVVKKRLDAAGLGPFCLEVHSSKTSKTTVVESLNARLGHQTRRPRALTVENNLQAIENARRELIYYVEKTNQAAGQTGLSVRDVLLGSAIREDSRKALPETVSTARFPNALTLTPQVRQVMRDSAANLEQQTAPLMAFGSVADHPWRGITNSNLTGLEIDAVLSAFDLAANALGELAKKRAEFEQKTTSQLPNTIRELQEQIASIANVRSAQGEVDEEVFRRLLGPAPRKLVTEIVSSLNAVLSAEAQLGKYVTEPTTARAGGSSVAEDAAKCAARLSIADSNTIELLNRISTLQFEHKKIESCVRAGSALAAAFKLTSTDTYSLKAALVAAEQLEKLPRKLWSRRSPCLVEESNRANIKKASSMCADLKSRRRNLEKEWDASLIPPSIELKTCIIALRSTNWISSLFNSQCRTARSLEKVANIGQKKKFSREELALALSNWMQLKDAESAFTTSTHYASVIGESFRGLDTDFPNIEPVSDWAERVREVLKPFGSTGAGLCRFLFDESVASLHVASSATQDPSFHELSRVLKEYTAEPGLTLEQVANEIHRTCTDLQAVVSAVEALTFQKQLEISKLAELARILRAIETGRDSIERQSSELGVKIAITSFRAEQLNSTLTFAEAICAASLSPSLKRWVFQESANLTSGQQMCFDLQDRLTSAIRAVNDADRLTVFDWDLWCKCKTFEDIELHVAIERFTKARRNDSKLQDYLNFLLAEQAANDDGLSPITSAYISARADYRDLSSATEFVFYRSAAEQVLNEDPKLRRHSGASHNQLRTQYQQLDKDFIDIRRQLLAEKVAARTVPQGVYQGRVSELTELALVQHIAGQVRPRISLRDFFRRAGTTIQGLKPCWMMSPMSVAQYLEQGQLKFDLVVMDEASQIRPEEALGAVARGAQVVVVGDQMQLPPTSFFQRLSADGAGEEDEEVEDVQQESVLEAAAARFYPPRMLKWHYRSEHGSLISFSNSEFYGDELTVFPSPFHDHADYGVKLNRVDGIYGAGVNEQEAKAVVNAALEFMSTQPDQSLGIVAVNSKQAELIRELVDQLCASEPEAEAYRAKWDGGLEALFVKNLENVQGDERDAIFISTVYGKDANGNFYQRFGPINSGYGHRRLNVLFTRAKKKVVLFSSMNPEDIQDEGKSWGVRALKAYLQFARTGSWVLPTESTVECDSVFEEWVLRALRANGFDAVPQLGLAGYRLDLAVRHPSHSGTFLCGIECDGATYHSARSVRERDRLRQEVLERLGWNIYRIWSTDWFRNPALQTKNLLAHLKLLAVGG
jgi:very-short-patch-repair endonuclease